jgi:DNA (cytosine-5)-methyltransferase 1
MIRIGSLFAGIGGFELGIERAIPNAHTIWQVEQNTYCQSILRKHWPNAKIYDDVRTVGAHNLQPIDILIGGFPCQDISTAGKQRGIKDGTRSGLWWEMHRLILELRPRIVIMENVANIITVGGADVIGSLAKIGYDCEWQIISAQQCGAPHLRKRWFCVAYPTTMPNRSRAVTNTNNNRIRSGYEIQTRRPPVDVHDHARDVTNAHGIGCDNRGNTERKNTNRLYIKRDTTQDQQQGRKRFVGIGSNGDVATNAHGAHCKRNGGTLGGKTQHTNIVGECKPQTYWQRTPAPEPTICYMDDGIPADVVRTKRKLHKQQLMALGNAIVPQCSEWVGQRVLQSGLLDDLINQ